jgi:hypothetical protein
MKKREKKRELITKKSKKKKRRYGLYGAIPPLCCPPSTPYGVSYSHIHTWGRKNE